MEIKKLTFMAACRDFFGLKEGLQKLGYEIIAAPGVPA